MTLTPDVLRLLVAKALSARPDEPTCADCDARLDRFAEMTLSGRDAADALKRLEAELAAYDDLLAELPDVFERRFQQRLEPLMERYRLLAEQVDPAQSERPKAALPGSSEPNNVVRFPGLRLPKFLRNLQRSA